MSQHTLIKTIDHSARNVVPQSGLPVAPAPWKLRGRWWVFLLSPLPKNVSFPAGWTTEWQADALARDEFVGGLGVVLVVQYDESPVGPYEELIYVPGRFKHSDGSVAFRITRIYVSTKDSTENGRRNWNIPTSREIRIHPRSLFSLLLVTIRVSSISDGSSATTPFFSATVRPIPLITKVLRVPCNTNSIPGNLFSLTQPPLPKGPLAEEIESGVETIEAPELNRKAKYAKVSPEVKCGMFLVNMTPELGNGAAVGDGVMFPAVKPWSIAAGVEGFDLTFPVSEWVEL